MRQEVDAIRVVAAVLRREDGAVLVTSRPEGKSLAGYFEFPGGKIEGGEDSWTAVVREVEEELGLILHSGRPLISYPFSYAQQTVQLEFWYSEDFSGQAVGHEGQQIRWENIDSLRSVNILPADFAVITALSLPANLVITPEFDGDSELLLSNLEAVFEAGYPLVQFRQSRWSDEKLASVLIRASKIAHHYGAKLVANCEPKVARKTDCDGLHLSSARLMNCTLKPFGFGLVSASVHNVSELQQAEKLELDFVLLGPVCKTSSHPNAVPLGWEKFASLTRPTALPVYALGGLMESDLESARAAGAQGIAGISDYWPTM